MRTTLLLPLAAGLVAGAVLMAPAVPAARPAAQAPRAPAFTQAAADAWLNTAPLTWESLRGTVTLVEFWTFACWNCYRSIPWLRTLEPRYGQQGFRIVSIHTPEFPHERERANVEAQLRQREVGYAVMLDNDYAYWDAFANRYWPAFYLVDTEGRVRAGFVGETHAGDRNATAMEAAIEALLAEREPDDKP